MKVRCFEPGAHPSGCTWTKGAVCHLPDDLAAAMVAAKAAEPVGDDVPLTNSVERAAEKKAKLATAPRAERKAESQEAATEDSGTGGNEADESAQPKGMPAPVPPPAPGRHQHGRGRR